MNSRTLFLAFGLAVSTGLLSACGSEADTTPEPPRAVKLETVGAGVAASASSFVATLRQEQRGDLAFENGGRIADIVVDVGDRVRKGQVLARLDAEPVRLRVAQAEANLRSAIAQAHERQTQLRQQQAMFEDGAISQATLTSAQVAFDAAQAQLRVAESDRALAARALRQSELRAPFDGSVVARLLQPQADAAAGQAVLQVEGQGQLQAVATLPVAIAQRLTPGTLVQARRAGAPDVAYALRLRSVSSRLESGASVQAIFDVAQASAPLRSGDSLLLALSEASGDDLSVPLPAVVPQRGKDAVFVYDAKAGTVARRSVELGQIEGGRVGIVAGLQPGEQVVIAGGAFLNDGQPVLPFRSASRLNEAQRP
ncbi:MULTISPECIES: efflux RND transporter periplasmic adaptor subunit [Pseudomonadota]|uniref:efflux RND transporter periplasmic adaptor subunit n=1 Tax=Pseudomonadota TaxID=1224 RepID=UPI001B6E598F|nr:efflux RND transporter periplasmic adaptor subunit [Pseudoxanthomonas sp.]MCH4578071.1 efflux RND transporter periplasmic adaptor subunit [Achromobacter xylosoxidans]